MTSFYQIDTPLTTHADPINPMHAANKRYVDSKLTNVNGARFVSGTIPVDKLPGFVGDVATVKGTNVLILGNSGVTAGVYNSFVVDAKGRITGGSYTPMKTTGLSWSQVQSKPTTLGGYGITDVISRIVGDTVGTISMSAVQATEDNAVLTKATVDSTLVTAEFSYAKPGEVVRRPTSTTPTGFLRANGGILDKATYATLAGIYGDSFSADLISNNMGQPWRQQYAFNTADNGGNLSWSTGTSLPSALVDSQAIVTQNRVYLLGGYNDSSYLSTVYTAPINADGTLGVWTTGASLPGTLAYSQAIVTQNRVYLLGGRYGTTYVSTVYTAPINADGTLGTWTTGTSLPGALGLSQAIVTKSRVYLLGGYNGSSYLSTVYTAPINADGTLGTWATGTSLPSALGLSQAIVTQNRVYLLGGYNGSSSITTVYTAPINADGTLGTWVTGTSLPGAIYAPQAIVTQNRVYLLGGRNESKPLSVVYTAPINSDGTLGTWTTGTSLPGALLSSQAIVTKSRVYLLGGSDGSPPYFSTVYTAPFSGGTNDYMTLIINSSIDTTTQFKLPDFSDRETDGLYYYVKY